MKLIYFKFTFIIFTIAPAYSHAMKDWRCYRSDQGSKIEIIDTGRELTLYVNGVVRHQMDLDAAEQGVEEGLVLFRFFYEGHYSEGSETGHKFKAVLTMKCNLEESFVCPNSVLELRTNLSAKYYEHLYCALLPQR